MMIMIAIRVARSLPCSMFKLWSKLFLIMIGVRVFVLWKHQSVILDFKSKKLTS